MILALDMGNTNIVVGCIDSHGKLYFTERISTDMNKTELGLYIRSTWEKGYNDGIAEAERLAKIAKERQLAEGKANEH